MISTQIKRQDGYTTTAMFTYKQIQLSSTHPTEIVLFSVSVYLDKLN